MGNPLLALPLGQSNFQGVAPTGSGIAAEESTGNKK
jgi:hypothetical protein